MTTALGISTSAHRGPITSRAAETLSTYLGSTTTATSPYFLSLVTDAYRTRNVSNCSKTHLYEEEYLEIPAVRIGFLVGYVLLITVSSLGNLFLIVYVVKSARFSGHGAASPMLILSLAVCDFLRSAVLTPFKFIEYLNNQEGSVTGDAYRRTATYFICLLGFAEFHSVAAISLERLLPICFPMKAKRWLRCRNVRLTMLVIWLLAASFSLAYVLVLCMTFELRLTSGSTYKLCTVFFFFFEGEPNDVSMGFSTFMFVFYYALPVLVVVVSYLMIFQILVPKPSLVMQRDKSFRSNASSSFSAHPQPAATTAASTRRQKSGCEYLANREAASRIMRERRRLAKIMLAITLCFAVFNSPVFLSYLGIGWGRRLHKNAIFWLFVIKFLPTVSSMFSPFVYCTWRKTLKRNFRSISYRGRISSHYKE